MINMGEWKGLRYYIIKVLIALLIFIIYRLEIILTLISIPFIFIWSGKSDALNEINRLKWITKDNNKLEL